MVVKVGDSLPDVKLFDSASPPDKQVSLQELFKGKKGILFAVPGAFTPVCSKSHLPGYVNDFEKFKAAGADIIVCTSTDNAFVLAEWGKAHHADGKVKLLGDPQAKLAKALGLETEVPFLGLVSKRYSAVINNNTIKFLNLESEDGASCTFATSTLAQLKEA